MTHNNYRMTLAFSLVLSIGLLSSCCINPYRANVPKLISSHPSIDEMRIWTLVDFGIFDWGLGEGADGEKSIDGRPTITWRKLVVCYDPMANYWIFNEQCTNTLTDLPKQTPFSLFDVKHKTTVSLGEISESLSGILNDNRGCPLVHLGKTNLFDVAVAQKDMPECSALFLSTDKGRGNNALFGKYIFTRPDTAPWRSSGGRAITETDIQVAFYNSFFSVLFTTDDYSELLKYLKNSDEDGHPKE